MPLCLALRDIGPLPLEVDGLLPETLRGHSLDEIRRRHVWHGNEQIELGAAADVSGSLADDSTLVWQGECGHVKRIGANLREGVVRVEGDAGMHVGAGMQGGIIEVHGNAGDWLGAEMSGGRIVVSGNAANLVGGAYRGAPRGMCGGEILIHGNAGNEVGSRMRRGLIAVAGRTGEAPGYGMIAGCLCLFGPVGGRPGAGMKRGTIGLWGPSPPDPPLSFRDAGRADPVILRVMLKYLRTAGFPIAGASDRCRRFCGDFLSLGKGELLYPLL